MTGSESKDVRLFDIRVVERNIKKGLITRKDVDAYFRALPDATDKIAEATEYVPGLTAAELNEAALASAGPMGHHHMMAPPAAPPEVLDDTGPDLVDAKVAPVADDDEEEDEEEDDDDADTDAVDDLPPTAA